ncbi:MAG TPA: radical SAM family heme chaperone HemW [Acidimicrobiales bacterium]|nr:radical SAM family heme chaperone HemW [Acidimicrobiales bacterium]
MHTEPLQAARHARERATFGVYVHIPFCAARCDYCAFATWTDRHHLMASYVEACVAEVTAASLPAADTVFFGGGTPSLLPAELLLSILAAVPRVPAAEVTVECNPDTVTPELMAAYRDGGVNRLSFGAQSTVDHVLEGLGRSHRRGALEAAMTAARAAGFDNVNVDLIMGGPGESADDWRRSLDDVLALEPEHVSAYALTVEAGTPLALDPARHPDDDELADKYLVAEEVLTEAGMASYEISNWARPGRECRHNLLYWRQGDYRGIGCAAHSHEAGRRWWNVRTPERYIAAVTAGSSPVAGEEHLDAATRVLEARQLALRTSDGVPVASLDDVDAIAGLVTVHDGRAVLSPRGRLLANEVSAHLR